MARTRPLVTATLSAVVALCIVPAERVGAACPELADPDMRALDDSVNRDPLAALGDVQRQLDAALRVAPPPKARLAQFYTILARAQYYLSLDQDSVDSAARGLALVSPTDTPLYARLLAQYWYSDNPNRARNGIEALEYERSQLPPDSLESLCLLVAIGDMHTRQNEVERAIEDLTRAYESASAPALAAARREAAYYLVLALNNIGDYQRALTLLDDLIAFARSHDNSADLAIGLYQRARTLTNTQQYSAAFAALTESRAISVRQNDQQSIAYDDQLVCQLHLDAGMTTQARGECETALTTFTRLGYPMMIVRTGATLAAIDLSEGHVARALATLNRLLKEGATTMPELYLQPILLQRARTNAAAGNHAQAYQDLNAYLDMHDRTMNAHRGEQIAAVRSELEARQAQEDARHELSEAQAMAQTARLDRVVRNLAIGFAGFILLGSTIFYQARRRRAEAVQASEAMQGQLAAVARVTGGVAHDFNNLLTVTSQAAGLLGEMPAVNTDSNARTLVSAIKSATESGAMITRQLQAVSRQLDLRPQRISIGEFLAAARPVLVQSLGTRGTLEHVVTDPEAHLFVDRAQLLSALVNLVTNAAEALTVPGPVTVTAGIATPETFDAGENRWVRIAVRDRGRGMTPEVLQQATQAFYSTKQPGAGSGLGLSMVDGFIHQSGGHLQIDSTEGAGTTISLWLRATDEG